MTSKPTPTTSAVLPKEAREALVAAAQLHNPRERSIAVQKATERIRRRYPQFFKTEKE